jgi:hypothetical protein
VLQHAHAALQRGDLGAGVLAQQVHHENSDAGERGHYGGGYG